MFEGMECISSEFYVDFFIDKLFPCFAPAGQVNEAQLGVSITWTGRGLKKALCPQMSSFKRGS